jgi:hypothetical protein
LNCGNTNSDGLVHSPQHPLCGQTQPQMRHASQGCARQAHQWHVYSQQAGGSCHIGGRIGCVISYFQDEPIAKLVIRYWRVQTLEYILQCGHSKYRREQLSCVGLHPMTSPTDLEGAEQQETQL